MTTDSTLLILLDAHGAAAVLGVSLRTFRELIKTEGFPAARSLGPRSTRWVRTELEAWAVALPDARGEHDYMAAAREARASRRPTAHAPFPAA